MELAEKIPLRVDSRSLVPGNRTVSLHSKTMNANGTYLMCVDSDDYADCVDLLVDSGRVVVDCAVLEKLRARHTRVRIHETVGRPEFYHSVKAAWQPFQEFVCGSDVCLGSLTLIAINGSLFDCREANLKWILVPKIIPTPAKELLFYKPVLTGLPERRWYPTPVQFWRSQAAATECCSLCDDFNRRHNTRAHKRILHYKRYRRFVVRNMYRQRVFRYTVAAGDEKRAFLAAAAYYNKMRNKIPLCAVVDTLERNNADVVQIEPTELHI